MSEDRCECCDLPSYSCGKTKEKQLIREDKQLRGRLLRSGHGWFTSSWGGKCIQCREWFPPGTPLRRSEAPEGYRAYCCATPEEVAV